MSEATERKRATPKRVLIAREARAAVRPHGERINAWQLQIAQLKALAGSTRQSAAGRAGAIEVMQQLADAIAAEHEAFSATVNALTDEAAASGYVTDCRKALTSVAQAVDNLRAQLSAPHDG